jgi:epoxyqueuosine reductase
MLTNEIIIEKSRAIGFDQVGFAKAELLREEILHLEDWLNKGYNAGMQYMERNLEKRLDIGQILPGAKSVISLALNYYTDEKHSAISNKGKISRYAFGTDYHLIIWEKLDKLINELKSIDPNLKQKAM